VGYAASDNATSKRTVSFTLKAEDRWGNPTDKTDASFKLTSNLPVKGLPQEINQDTQNDGVLLHEGLSVSSPGDIYIELRDSDNALVSRSNPLRIVEDSDLLPFWGELHGNPKKLLVPIRLMTILPLLVTRQVWM